MNFYRDYNFVLDTSTSKKFISFFDISFEVFDFLSSFSVDFYNDKKRFLTDSEIYFLVSSLDSKIDGVQELPTIFIEKITGAFISCYKSFQDTLDPKCFSISFYSFFDLDNDFFSFSFPNKKLSFLDFDFFIDDDISCLLEKKINKITLSFVSNTLSVCFHCSFFKPVASIIHSKTFDQLNFVGIDLGLKEFATLSNGHIINNEHFFKNEESKIKELQHKLSKCEYKSKNWLSYKKKLSKNFKKISNRRKDFFHKLSKDLVLNFDVICFEKLDIKSLSSKDKKSKNVLDASWGIFIKMVQYKAKEYGKIVIFIDQYFPSSKTCSNCKSVNKIDLSVRTFNCSYCNFSIDRDLNAAINIKNEGVNVFSKGFSKL